MITFPVIWGLFPAFALVFVTLSYYLTRSGKMENEKVSKGLVGAGAVLGIFTLGLPFFEQPTFINPLIRYVLGLPLLVLGILGRVYPMMYLRKKETTTTLDKVDKLVESGPYSWVRHPQYTAGLVMLLGWYLLWGGWYALGVLPFMAGIIYIQALIEEKYILKRIFGESYAAYQERVGMLLPRFSEKHSLHITTAFLGIYAGLLTVQHGFFEIMQGSRDPGGLMFNAIGSPCQAEKIWHACFPAMTLIPNLFITGITAVLVGLGMAVWAAAFVGCRYGWFVLGVLSFVALLVGGGFVPVFIGMVAAAAGSRLGSPVKPGCRGWHIASALWPCPLVLLAFWIPGSWLMGHFFSAAMLSAGGLLFLVFDVGLPVLSALSGLAHTNRYKEK